MPADPLSTVSRLCKWTTVTLGSLCLFTIAVAFVHPGDRLESLIFRQKNVEMPWKMFQSEDVERGVVIPSSTHVIFHLPLDMKETEREVLFGGRGKDVRYWGYCFAENYDPRTRERREGLPGLLFLSEKERAVRAEAASAQTGPVQNSLIRHQVETFSAGMICYVMAEQTLTLGIDSDNDRLNTQLEHEIGTNPAVSDTDSDGIPDGTEFPRTNPLLRDSDSDGLLDGIEDANGNGRVDRGETDPRVWDSDRDGLCDGNCRVKLGNGQQVFLGEDLDLDGKFDTGETNPLSKDTDGDGTIDYIEKVK